MTSHEAEIDDRLPIAATDGRAVDEIDVSGWGVFKGHAIPLAVARFIAEKINLYHQHRASALSDELEKVKAELNLARAERDFWRVADKKSVERAERAEAALSSLRARVWEWDDVYAAFIGAFDTPLARRRFSDDYAKDARRRLSAFDGSLRAARQLVEDMGEQAHDQ